MSKYRLYRVMYDWEGKHCGNEYIGEVITCKDCRHSRIEGDTTLFMWCGYWNKPTDGNRYCSDGERREP